jgi:hypothetical protein
MLSLVPSEPELMQVKIIAPPSSLIAEINGPPGLQQGIKVDET